MLALFVGAAVEHLPTGLLTPLGGRDFSQAFGGNYASVVQRWIAVNDPGMLLERSVNLTRGLLLFFTQLGAAAKVGAALWLAAAVFCGATGGRGTVRRTP